MLEQSPLDRESNIERHVQCWSKAPLGRMLGQIPIGRESKIKHRVQCWSKAILGRSWGKAPSVKSPTLLPTLNTMFNAGAKPPGLRVQHGTSCSMLEQSPPRPRVPSTKSPTLNVVFNVGAKPPRPRVQY